MHSYLRAIGFSKLEQKDLDQILQEHADPFRSAC